MYVRTWTDLLAKGLLARRCCQNGGPVKWKNQPVFDILISEVENGRTEIMIVIPIALGQTMINSVHHTKYSYHDWLYLPSQRASVDSIKRQCP